MRSFFKKFMILFTVANLLEFRVRRTLTKMELADKVCVNKKPLSEFRKAVYQSLRRRADILFDLIDALTVAGQVSSPVALSEQKPFQRKFCSV
ncbi:MAG: hypothetical protein IPG44_11725 [Anaerolineales bacterium]|nr:hypothetical protein [Anaerolineales bacterium]